MFLSLHNLLQFLQFLLYSFFYVLEAGVMTHQVAVSQDYKQESYQLSWMKWMELGPRILAKKVWLKNEIKNSWSKIVNQDMSTHLWISDLSTLNSIYDMWIASRCYNYILFVIKQLQGLIVYEMLLCDFHVVSLFGYCCTVSLLLVILSLYCHLIYHYIAATWFSIFQTFSLMSIDHSGYTLTYCVRSYVMIRWHINTCCVHGHYRTWWRTSTTW